MLLAAAGQTEAFPAEDQNVLDCLLWNNVWDLQYRRPPKIFTIVYELSGPNVKLCSRL